MNDNDKFMHQLRAVVANGVLSLPLTGAFVWTVSMCTSRIDILVVWFWTVLAISAAVIGSWRSAIK